MARNTTKTYITIDANGKPAAGELQRLEDQAKDTDKAVEDIGADSLSGLQAGIGGATAGLAKMAGPLGIGAVAGGLLKVADDAANIAIEAGTMATALDLTVEQASRLNAAFSDVGLEMNDTVDIALQIGQAITDDAELAGALGFAVGQVVEPVEALEAGIDRWDFLTPSQRAQAFGEEGVRQISRLVSEGETLDEILAGVSDNRIINEDALENAQEYKRATADISAAFEGVVIQLSTGLIPLLARAAELSLTIANTLGLEFTPWEDSLDAAAADRAAWQETEVEKRRQANMTAEERARAAAADQRGWDESRRAADAATEALEGVNGALGSNQRGWDESRRAADEAAGRYTRAGLDAERAFRKAKEEYDNLTRALDDRSTYLNLKDSFDELQTKGVEAWVAVDTEADNAEQASRDYEQALLDVQREVGNYLEQLGTFDDEYITRIVTELDGASAAETEAKIDQIARDRDLQVRIIANPQNFNPFLGIPGISGGNNRSTTNNITLNLARTTNPREMMATLDNWTRANG